MVHGVIIKTKNRERDVMVVLYFNNECEYRMTQRPKVALCLAPIDPNIENYVEGLDLNKDVRLTPRPFSSRGG